MLQHVCKNKTIGIVCSVFVLLNCISCDNRSVEDISQKAFKVDESITSSITIHLL
jgi:hypothetical protein